MPIRKDDILKALRGDKEGNTLSTEEWRRMTEQYPYCEIFVWHYLRALYRAEDISFDGELSRLAIHLCNKQAFYNFMVRKAEGKPLFVYNVASTDYFAQKGAEDIPLSELARRLKAARLGGAEGTFCKGDDKKNDIQEGGTSDVNSNSGSKKAETEEKKGSSEGQNREKEEAVNMLHETNIQQDINKTVGLLIKQKKFLEALEILKRENFANSKKNAYFAVQIKYIETILKSK